MSNPIDLEPGMFVRVTSPYGEQWTYLITDMYARTRVDPQPWDAETLTIIAERSD